MGKRQRFSTSAVHGRFPRRGELERRDPGRFVTSAMSGSAKAHLQIAPFFRYQPCQPRGRRRCQHSSTCGVSPERSEILEKPYISSTLGLAELSPKKGVYK